MIYALNGWFKSRVLIATLFIMLVPSYSYILYTLYFFPETVVTKDLVYFVLIAAWMASSMIILLNLICELEVNLISLERCINFTEIPNEENYLNYDIHKKNFLYPSKNHIKKIVENNREDVLFPFGHIKIENVSAKYVTKRDPVLKSLNIEVLPGEKIGVVGRTGAGKTSFIKIFWKGLDLSEGRIIIDGRDISRIDLKYLRKEIMVVSQETALFSGTIRENLDP